MHQNTTFTTTFKCGYFILEPSNGGPIDYEQLHTRQLTADAKFTGT